MDIQAVASQLVGMLGENPDLITNLVAHPYSTTAQATHTNGHISQSDMSQILTQVAASVSGTQLGSGQVAGAAQNLLGQNGGSVHALAGTLFGNVKPQDLSQIGEIALKSAIGGIVAKGLGTLIADAIGGSKPKK